jgi:hypothetical protein
MCFVSNCFMAITWWCCCLCASAATPTPDTAYFYLCSYSVGAACVYCLCGQVCKQYLCNPLKHSINHLMFLQSKCPVANNSLHSLLPWCCVWLVCCALCTNATGLFDTPCPRSPVLNSQPPGRGQYFCVRHS